MRLDMHSRKELVRTNYEAYQKAGKKERGEILDRLVPVSGMNRDYLAWTLGHHTESNAEKKGAGKGRKKRAEGKRGGRPAKYGQEFVKVLSAIWSDHGQPCGKLLVPMIHGILDFLTASRDPDYGITGEMRDLLLEVSAAEADILLKPIRKALGIKGISTTRAVQTPLRSQIPVKPYVDRETMKPGFFAFDTVAHCGGSAAGQFCKTLTGTDPFSGWTEERALLNAANHWVKAAFEDIEGHLPFPLLGAHYDNGMEFINAPLLAWCLERHIEPSRGRPYHKNDNPYAEQKNYDAVRKAVGYFRFDTVEERDALTDVYRSLCPLYNYWYPSFKLLEKAKQADGRYKKVYEKKPRTPVERLLESADISEECKTELRRRKESQNPVELNNALNAAVERLLRLNREKGYCESAPRTDAAASCQEASQALTA